MVRTRYLLALCLSVATVLFLLFGIGALGLAALSRVAAGAWSTGLVLTDRVSASIPDFLMLTAMYAALFATAAWLFHRSERPTAG